MYIWGMNIVEAYGKPFFNVNKLVSAVSSFGKTFVKTRLVFFLHLIPTFTDEYTFISSSDIRKLVTC